MGEPRVAHALRLVVASAAVACGGDPSPPEGRVAPGADAEPATVAARVEPPAPAPPGFVPWLVDEAAARGLVFVHESGHRERYLMPEIMGGGAALLDVDDDGDLDAYAVQGRALDPAPGETPPGNALFLNDGTGRFADVSATSGADDRGYGMGVACGDADGDGDVDLYVTNVGRNALLLNDGAGHFTDTTAVAGVGDDGFAASVAFVDLDVDGRLDLFVTNYLGWTAAGELTCHNDMGGLDYCDPANYAAPARDVVYRNLGGGRFEDVTDACGVGALPGTGLGVVAGDFDDDGRPDVFVANDGMPDRLWMNRVAADGALRLEDDGLLAGCALDHSGRAKAGMGVAAADVDHDGDLDLLVCNLDKQTDSFYLNDAGLFTDTTLSAGLAVPSRTFTRFGIGLVDLDHDGRLDLFQANGRVRRQARLWAEDPYAEPNLLLRGRPGPRFEPLPGADGTAAPHAGTSRGAAFGDVDGDGGVDVLVVDRDGPAQLLVNRAPDRGAWVVFDVRDAAGAPCLGATVRLRAGERELRADVRAAASYLSSSDPRVHLGLGDAVRVTDVVVRWPDGAREAFGEREVRAVHVLRRGEGEPVR